MVIQFDTFPALLQALRADRQQEAVMDTAPGQAALVVAALVSPITIAETTFLEALDVPVWTLLFV